MKTLHKLTHFQILLGSLNLPVNFDEKMKEILLSSSPEKVDNFERIFLRLKVCFSCVRKVSMWVCSSFWPMI